MKLNAVQTLALAAFGVILGEWLKRRIPILYHLNVPAPVIGGLAYATTILVLRARHLNIEFDTVLQPILMVGFFTTIGLNASYRIVKQGGAQVIGLLALATFGAILQNGLGIVLAKAFHLDPLLGIVSGAVALAGGPATALSFGPEFERMGVPGATATGVASAMFGIAVSGLIGGWIGGRPIARKNLRPPDNHSRLEQAIDSTTRQQLLHNTILIAIAMGLGTLISAQFTSRQILLPAYIGALIAAAIMRNIEDRFGVFAIHSPTADAIGNTALSIFIVMALLSLRLWELAQLALPLLTILCAQILLGVVLCKAAFHLLGRDFEAAVMTGGFCGFMLGTTANAMACMSVLTNRYGPAPRAYVVVPLVGGSLIDFTNAAIITQMANMLR